MARPRVPPGREPGTLQSRVSPSRSRAPALSCSEQTSTEHRGRTGQQATADGQQCHVLGCRVTCKDPCGLWTVGTQHSCDAVTLIRKRCFANKAKAADRAHTPLLPYPHLTSGAPRSRSSGPLGGSAPQAPSTPGRWGDTGGRQAIPRRPCSNAGLVKSQDRHSIQELSVHRVHLVCCTV